MSPPRIFDSECDGDTLVIMLLGDVSTLLPDDAKRELNQALAKLQPPSVRHVVVDFEQVGYFGSLMLGSLHTVWRRVLQAGGRMALCNVSATGREVLRVAKFDTLWPICSSRADALAAVRQNSRQAG